MNFGASGNFHARDPFGKIVHLLSQALALLRRSSIDQTFVMVIVVEHSRGGYYGSGGQCGSISHFDCH
jgi:hypothetical protein